MRVLVIEDSPVDFRLVERALGAHFSLTHALTLAAGLAAAAADQFDLVILDLSLDDSRGYETFERARRACPTLPILVLSGNDDEELALRALSNGAQDFVRKSGLLDYPLDRTARYAIERQRVDDAARRSEQQFRALFDNLPTAAYTCDPQGLITYYNQKAVELWGRTPKLNDPSDRYCGSSELFAADGTPIAHAECWMARTLRERRGFNGCEILIGLPGGDRRAALAHANPVLDESGTFRGAINVLIDVSRQRQTDRELRESERFAKATVNSLTANIAIIDEAGVILSVNAAWRRFAEDNGTPSCGHGVGANYLHVCDRAAEDGDEVARAAATGIRSILRRERDAFELEYPCHSPSEQRWVLMRATPFDGEGPTRIVINHEDVTARKTAERLAREQFGLKEAVAGMEQVLGVVGHELRTPLAALRAITEFLTTDGARDTAQADQFLREMSEEVDRMSDTVNNLLEAARLNSGRAKWNWSQVDLAEVAEDAVASVRPLVDETKVRLVVRTESSDCQLLGDGEAIRRLLVNFLSNARKYTVAGQIEVRCRRYDDARGTAWIDLEVADTGCGIRPEVSARLGEAFALNSGVVGNNYVSGTGLGLAICKGIAAAHGGELLIRSVEGQGTTVTARIRAALDAAACGDTVRDDSMLEVAA